MDAEKYIQEIEQEMTHGSQNVILDSFQDLIKSVGKRVIFIENNDDSRLLKEVQRQCMFCLIGEIAAKNTKPYQMNVSTTMRKVINFELGIYWEYNFLWLLISFGHLDNGDWLLVGLLLNRSDR